MPELPEVETARRRIEAGALNRTIERVVLGNDTTHLELPTSDARARFLECMRSAARFLGENDEIGVLANHHAMAALPYLIPGHTVSDVVAILGSLDPILGEVDR